MDHLVVTKPLWWCDGDGDTEFMQYNSLCVQTLPIGLISSPGPTQQAKDLHGVNVCTRKVHVYIVTIYGCTAGSVLMCM